MNCFKIGVIGTLLLFAISSCNGKKDVLEKNEVTWNYTHKGIWKSEVNDVPEFNLLSVSKKEPRVEAIEQLSEATFPIDKKEIISFTKSGKTYLRFPLAKEEKIYGLGLQFKNVQQRGRIYRLHMDHYGNADDGRTHAPVPFYISSKGYGVLINTARYVDVNVGVAVTKDSKHPAEAKDRNTSKSWSSQPYSDNLEIIVPEEGVELVMFAGKDMMEVVQRFNLYCGGGFIPPKWGLGFWQRVKTRYTDEQVRNEVAEFKDHDFPLDVIGLEPGWHSKAYPCTFEWSKERFPNPEKLSNDLLNDGIRLNLWCNPYLWPDSNLDKKMSPFTATHTVWCGTVPDYTIPSARSIFQEHIRKNQLDIGISGFKIDEVDGKDNWLFSDMTMFPSGKDGEQMRSVYGNLMMRMVDEEYRKINTRTFGLVRAANVGSVNYPFVIYNDCYSHRDFITALINSGFNGVLWTPEVRKSKTGEEWVRRMQTVCFSPMAMINAWADGTKPWEYDELYKNCRDVAFLRMRLLPYIYSIFAQYYFNGIPPFRAVNLENGFAMKNEVLKTVLDGTKNPYEEHAVKSLKDQYMMGESIMVAPLFAGETSREVILPKGNWYDFYTGKYIGNGEPVNIECGLDKIPLFVKDGAIIPRMPAIRQTNEWTDNIPLEVRHYGEADGKFQLYDDDGNSYDYEKGKYTLKEFRYENHRGKVKSLKENGAWSYGKITWKKM